MISSNLLVSCVMPTWNRRAFIPAAIDSWQRQTYDNRELVILDDGEEPIEDLLPDDTRIRYTFEDRRRITGDKRNRVNELSRGALICHFDDDDWSAPDRIEFQVELLRKSQKPVTGFGTLFFWDSIRGVVRKYRAHMAGYVCGTTLCYTREFWMTRKFRSKHEASDNDFVYPILNQIEASDDSSHMVARIHSCHHTSRKAAIPDAPGGPTLLPAAFWENEALLRDGELGSGYAN